MNETEKAQIQRFLEDEPVKEIIKKVLLNEFDLNKAIPNLTLNNMILGEIARACIEGKKLLEKGFIELEKYKKVEEPKPSRNEAR